MERYQETSMAAVFFNRVDTYGNQACVGYKDKDGKYQDISWNEMNEMIRNLGAFLLSKNIQPGDKIALFSANCYEWWVADLAIISAGAVNVPIYATNSAEEARYVIDNSDSTLCFAGSRDHLKKILEIKDKLPNVTQIIAFEEPDMPIPGVISMKDALTQGKTAGLQDELDRRIQHIKGEEVATLIYTSGTTGNPKGVMLSHNNFIANCQQCVNVDPELFSIRHTLLSFLPLSHSLERTVGYYIPIFMGLKVVFAEDFSRILQNFQEVRPTFIVSVPRLYEKIHTGIISKLGSAPPMKKKLFAWAMSVAKRNLEYFCNNKPRTGLFALEYKLADKLIFSKLKAALGMDRLQLAISGGGPLSMSDAEFFLGMSIKVIEGFGLTETTPVTNVNKPEKIKPGTVGPALKDTIVKIGEEEEILIKGPQVMLGYYKHEAATKEVFTADGFFRTGDIGTIDSDGYLKITGRLKDLIITSGGKNISPQNIENSIKASNYIEQVAVIGDNRKYLSALIVPAFEELENWARQQGIPFNNRRELICHEAVNELFKDEIGIYTADYARVEQIKKFQIMEQEWSQETDELTPTLKLKRRVINEKYADEIDLMYPQGLEG